jgi:hypothetical protein
VNKDYVPSAPHLLRLVTRSLIAFVAALMAVAAFVPAPLKSAADPANPPNPAKSAWFLLWIQELVSHGTRWMVLVLALAVAFVALPWLRRGRAEHAAWFPNEGRIVSLVTLALAIGILLLTVVGLYFRGEQWRLVAPF